MATSRESQIMSRGLLTDAEKAFLRGEKTDVDEAQYRYNVRSNFRTRMDELEQDIQLLQEAGEDDLVNEFFSRFGRVERLEQELGRVEELEAELQKIRAELEDAEED